MNTTAFENSIKSEGYGEIETKGLTAGTSTSEHAHPFHVRALVIEGEISLSVAGVTRTYSKGEEFTMAAGCAHAEQIGAQGVRYVVGRRRDAAG